MLFITITKRVTQGECRINGQPCDFEVHDNEFWFLYRDAENQDWDERGSRRVGN